MPSLNFNRPTMLRCGDQLAIILTKGDAGWERFQPLAAAAVDAGEEFGYVSAADASGFLTGSMLRYGGTEEIFACHVPAEARDLLATPTGLLLITSEFEPPVADFAHRFAAGSDLASVAEWMRKTETDNGWPTYSIDGYLIAFTGERR